MLDKVLRRSDAIDKESLCILAGQRVSFHFTRRIICVFIARDVGMACSPNITFFGRCRKYA